MQRYDCFDVLSLEHELPLDELLEVPPDEPPEEEPPPPSELPLQPVASARTKNVEAVRTTKL